MNKEIVKVEKLSKSFLNRDKSLKRVINDLTFSIYEGEFLGIIGTSGSGKTTLIRCLLRLESIDSGEIKYHEHDLLKLNEIELKTLFRNRVRLIYQHPEAVLNPGLTINEILRQPYKLYNRNEDEYDSVVKSLLDEVNIPEFYLSKYPHQLSGGEKRRIALARALMTEPSVIFADEPFSGLDKVLQYKMLSMLMKLKKKHNLTLIVISHDVDIMLEVCDRIILMHEGNIEEIANRKNDVIKLNSEYGKAFAGVQLAEL